MRSFLFYFIQISLILALAYVAYLPTIRLDMFYWGNSKYDGLYLLVIPLAFLPVVILLSVLKFLVVRKRVQSDDFKWSFMVSIGAVSFDCLLLVYDSDTAYLIITFGTLIVCMLLAVEMILIRKQWIR